MCDRVVLTLLDFALHLRTSINDITYGLTNDKLHNELMTNADKLRKVLENSTLPNFFSTGRTRLT